MRYSALAWPKGELAYKSWETICFAWTWAKLKQELYRNVSISNSCTFDSASPNHFCDVNSKSEPSGTTKERVLHRSRVVPTHSHVPARCAEINAQQSESNSTHKSNYKSRSDNLLTPFTPECTMRNSRRQRFSPCRCAKKRLRHALSCAQSTWPFVQTALKRSRSSS